MISRASIVIDFDLIDSEEQQLLERSLRKALGTPFLKLGTITRLTLEHLGEVHSEPINLLVE